MIVAFDIGNVLLRWNPRNLYRKMFADPREMEHFLSTALDMSWVVETDRARSFQPALDTRIAAFPHYAEHLRAFDERWLETLDGAIEENVALMRRLRARGDKVYAITNFNDDKFIAASALHAFLGEFDGVIVSGREGLTKPDAPIFELFLSRYGLRADEVLFVDDSARNVSAARALGMQAIHFVDGVDLEKEFVARGLLS
jgi:2-haloacid dehalogenase